MEPTTDTPEPEQSPAPPAPPQPVRLPRPRWMGALAAAMLGAGIAIGAAIGPAPAASLAGDVPDLAKAIPLLISQLESQHRAQANTSTATSPPPATPEPAPATTSTEAAKPAATATPSEETTTTPTKETKPASSGKKLPAIKNVWLIQLDGGTLTAAIAQKPAAPYINGSLVPAATILTGWSAPQATAFASEAVLAEPPAAGAVPPILHTIVQPPCAEGNAACAPETPGQLTAADEFLKATLTSITGLATYKEGGLAVVTFASVGIPTQQELPAGTSTATLAYQPAGGVALLSPFAKAGSSSVAFNPTSPRQTLEKLLH